MRRIAAAVALAFGLIAANVGAAQAQVWGSTPTTNTVVSQPSIGGGYPVPPGQTAPDPGTCRAGRYNSNFSESWIAVRPGTEQLVGVSKFFFEKFSTFYDFHLGSF